MDRKTNNEVLDDVENERNLMGMIKTRQWKIIGHTIILSEELHNVVLESACWEGSEQKNDIASSFS